MLKFEAPKGQSSIIKVIGVGGGGNNAVNHMFKQGIVDVDFIQCNTDAQILESSAVPIKIQLGTTGLGAGNRPDIGRRAAEESIEAIREVLELNTKMLFITAGMGGGTGTGAAPVIASIARELDILTVGIVTIPFSFEGRKRKLQAEQGIDELKKYVDTLLVINNDRLREFYGDLKLTEAFSHADDVLTRAAKGIAEIITVKAYINVDFEDVKTVMKNSGKAIMGSSIAAGPDRAIKAAQSALASPLLNDNDIGGARNMLLYIASGLKNEITMDEVSEITDFIQESAGNDVDIIWGVGFDETLEESISITLIATAFENHRRPEDTQAALPKNIFSLGDTMPEPPPQENTSHEEKAEIKMVTPQPKEERHTSYTPHPATETSANSQAAPETQTRKVFSLFQEPESEITNKFPAQSSSGQPDKNETTHTEPQKEANPDIEKISNDRIRTLRNFSLKLRSLDSITEIETQPAFVRRSVNLEPTPSSAESVVPKMAVSDNGNSGAEIRKNTYLYDKPD
jgi:cell division protein FtsZ